MIGAAGLPATVDVLIVGGGATGAGLMRDLSRRGLRCLMIDKGDLGSGTSGRYHGLLHSGARYIARDPQAARECIHENRTIRQIAPACVEDTGGLFVATPDDPDDYVDQFATRCAAADIPCEEVPLAEVFRLEPALNRRIRRAFRVPDASLEPWQLIEANLEEAQGRGSRVLAYHQLVGIERNGGFITAATIADVRSGSVERISPRVVVSAAGAWAGRVAALAGVKLDMSPGKGTMLVYNQRMTDTTINRCHPPGDGDIMVPVHTVAILGTTDIHVDDPDHYEIDRHEIEALITEGEKLFPDLRRMRLMRAYAGVRPLYDPAESAGGSDRMITRSHAVIDHARRDDIANFVSIVGGKLTTYRLMAEQTANVVADKLGIDVPCTTGQEPLPGQGHDRSYYWLGDRLAAHEADGGGDAALICECEFVTRHMLEQFLAERWPCSLDDVRRGTRLGMGPCQGAFCTFRAAGIVADAVAGRALWPADTAVVEPPPPALPAPGAPPAEGPDGAGAIAGNGDLPDPHAQAAELAERAVVAFLRERYKGGRPIAWGRQLQELWIATGIYWGTLGVDAFEPAGTHSADRERGLAATAGAPGASDVPGHAQG
ncbi:MAG TPA: anaerobic glycerol-3-phosphate dehydrogenase subunit GlpA [Candidatus Limnocylindrales bacterium]|nr:anaerobic glycerol-3-phosphate dehydrogenase subunit GlpA [Candidatus Limnocylindrales bacterium]